MKLSIRWLPAFLLLLSITTFARKPAEAGPSFACHPERLASVSASIFVNEKARQVWVAADPMSDQFLASIGSWGSRGFRRAGRKLGDLKGLPVPSNAGPCAPDAKRSHTNFYSSLQGPFTLVATAGCHEGYAKELGLKPLRPDEDNFGSMESGIQIHGSRFETCNNGSTLVPCDKLVSAADRAQSLNCWKELSSGN